ncbi:MAG TPA: pyridoxal-phosphate dependent enzyme [Terriglobales bacterium]|nr:pyridoxal-phosphate dependent enzyme [Terriglobales bacterium]
MDQLVGSSYAPLATVRGAQQFLRRYLPVTRLVEAASLSALIGRKVHLKLETEQPTGSFKPRGALWALSRNLERRRVREVVASSTGNHGAAVALAGKVLGVQATIFLPENPNPVKRARIAALGARIVEEGSLDLAQAFQKALAYAKKDGVYFLNDATDLDVPVGPATIACEIFEQLPEVACIYVPMGDTALIRGIASAAKQLSARVRIVGVQAERAPSYRLSWEKGEPVPTASCDTIADGLATRTPEADNVRAIREMVDDIRLVSEQQMLDAIRHLLLEEHIVAEPAGAAATAALIAEPPIIPGPVVALVTGANVTPAVLRSAICGVDA